MRYTLQAPLYDRVVTFAREREHSIALLRIRRGERVLIVGAGTGADLPFIPAGVTVVAVDLTRAMLARAQRYGRSQTAFALADAHALGVRDGAADVVVLHMILAVVGRPSRCLEEAARILRPGGRIGIFDKFLPDGAAPTFARRAAAEVADLFFNTARSSLADIRSRSSARLDVEHDEWSAHRPFRHVVLRKPPHP